MRRQSLKKQKERRVSSKLENAIKDNLQDRCEVCGSPCELQRHHIAAGSHRRELANFRSTQYLCQWCHEVFQSTDIMKQFIESCLITAKAINGEFGSQRLDMDKIAAKLRELI